jgi:hypothetical protein
MDRTVTFKQEEISGLEPRTRLDTKTDRLTDRQSQCDFDYKYKYFLPKLSGLWLQRNSLFELPSRAIFNPPDHVQVVIILGSRLCNVWV